jgi:hypothetical protein
MESQCSPYPLLQRVANSQSAESRHLIYFTAGSPVDSASTFEELQMTLLAFRGTTEKKSPTHIK